MLWLPTFTPHRDAFLHHFWSEVSQYSVYELPPDKWKVRDQGRGRRASHLYICVSEQTGQDVVQISSYKSHPFCGSKAANASVTWARIKDRGSRITETLIKWGISLICRKNDNFENQPERKFRASFVYLIIRSQTGLLYEPSFVKHFPKWYTWYILTRRVWSSKVVWHLYK